jgi:hypothetical protein
VQNDSEVILFLIGDKSPFPPVALIGFRNKSIKITRTEPTMKKNSSLIDQVVEYTTKKN